MARFKRENPADNEFISVGPSVIRENFLSLKEDKIVNAEKLQDLVPGNRSGQIPVANGKLCENLNAEKLGGHPATYFSPATHEHPTANGERDGFLSKADWQKLQSIAAGAQVNQNAFSTVKVGTTEIVADNPTDTLEIQAGEGIGLTADATNDRLTINLSSVAEERIGTKTIDQTQNPSGNSGLISQLFSWLANRIKAITGKENWYDTPASTIEALHNEKVNKSGDTMNGPLGFGDTKTKIEKGSLNRLRITTDNGYLELGTGDTAYAHFLTEATNGYHFNKNLSVAGEIFAGADYNQKVWHAGNFNPAHINSNGTLILEVKSGDKNVVIDDADQVWNGDTYGSVITLSGDKSVVLSLLKCGGFQAQRKIETPTLILTPLTEDPPTPVNGQIWMRA